MHSYASRPRQLLHDQAARLQIHSTIYHRPCRRSRFASSAGTLHYLAVRRFTAARCRQMGMQRLRPGVWYDDLAEVMYAQCTASDDWGL